MSTYIGVNHQYKVEAAGRHELTVYVQNLGAERAPQPASRSACHGSRAHVRRRPQDDLIEEEDEE